MSGVSDHCNLMGSIQSAMFGPDGQTLYIF